jgi:hypothetical protein
VRDFLKNLKEGDKVIVSKRFCKSVGTVEKITPAGNIKVNGTLYTAGGVERGGDQWSKGYLYEATPAVVEEIKKENTISKALILMRNKPKITFEQAKKIVAILYEGGGE